MKALLGIYRLAIGYVVLRVNHKDEYVVHFISNTSFESAMESAKDEMEALLLAEGSDGDYCANERRAIIKFNARIVGFCASA